MPRMRMFTVKHKGEVVARNRTFWSLKNKVERACAAALERRGITALEPIKSYGRLVAGRR